MTKEREDKRADREFEAYLEGRSRVARGYEPLRELEPPEALDRAVLEQARSAVEDARRRAGLPFWQRWSSRIAVAVVAVLGLGVVLRLGTGPATLRHEAPPAALSTQQETVAADIEQADEIGLANEIAPMAPTETDGVLDLGGRAAVPGVSTLTPEAGDSLIESLRDRSQERPLRAYTQDAVGSPDAATAGRDESLDGNTPASPVEPELPVKRSGNAERGTVAEAPVVSGTASAEQGGRRQVTDTAMVAPQKSVPPAGLAVEDEASIESFVSAAREGTSVSAAQRGRASERRFRDSDPGSYGISKAFEDGEDPLSAGGLAEEGATPWRIDPEAWLAYVDVLIERGDDEAISRELAEFREAWPEWSLDEKYDPWLADESSRPANAP